MRPFIYLKTRPEEKLFDKAIIVRMIILYSQYGILINTVNLLQIIIKSRTEAKNWGLWDGLKPVPESFL